MELRTHLTGWPSHIRLLKHVFHRCDYKRTMRTHSVKEHWEGWYANRPCQSSMPWHFPLHPNLGTFPFLILSKVSLRTWIQSSVFCKVGFTQKRVAIKTIIYIRVISITVVDSLCLILSRGYVIASYQAFGPWQQELTSEQSDLTVRASSNR